MSSKPKHQRPNHMTPAERDRAVALYRDGMTLDALAVEFDHDCAADEAAGCLAS